jgi:hypothetical protein
MVAVSADLRNLIWTIFSSTNKKKFFLWNIHTADRFLCLTWPQAKPHGMWIITSDKMIEPIVYREQPRNLGSRSSQWPVKSNIMPSTCQWSVFGIQPGSSVTFSTKDEGQNSPSKPEGVMAWCQLLLPSKKLIIKTSICLNHLHCTLPFIDLKCPGY